MDPGTSNVQYRQLQIANTEFYGFYVQDDWKVTPKITLNLGLRYEYQGGLWDPEYRLPQRLDLTDPVPGMAEAIDPRIPADIRARMAESAGNINLRHKPAARSRIRRGPRGTHSRPCDRGGGLK